MKFLLNKQAQTIVVVSQISFLLIILVTRRCVVGQWDINTDCQMQQTIVLEHDVTNINKDYVDGIGLTHRFPCQHIWTCMADILIMSNIQQLIVPVLRVLHKLTSFLLVMTTSASLVIHIVLYIKKGPIFLLSYGRVIQFWRRMDKKSISGYVQLYN